MNNKNKRRLWPYIWLGTISGLFIGLFTKFLIASWNIPLIRFFYKLFILLFLLSLALAIAFILITILIYITEEAILYVIGEKDA